MQVYTPPLHFDTLRPSILESNSLEEDQDVFPHWVTDGDYRGGGECVYLKKEMHVCVIVYMCFQGRVQVGGWDPGILWNDERCGSVSAIVGSSKLWKALCFLLFKNSIVFDCICIYWWQIVRCVKWRPTNLLMKFLKCWNPLAVQITCL